MYAASMPVTFCTLFNHHNSKYLFEVDFFKPHLINMVGKGL